MFKKIILTISLLLLSQNIIAEENYSCAADSYLFKECKFELPTILHGETQLESVDNNVFNGNVLVLCNNGKKTIISESCDYIQGAADSCKGIPSNTWTGSGDSMCTHSSVSISISNGDEYKITSLQNNGYVKYICEDSKLIVKSSECTRPESTKITTASTGSQCIPKSFSSNAQYDYVKKSWYSIAPNDAFCINEGFDYLDSYIDISTFSNLNTEHKGYFNTVCCSNDTLDSPNPAITVTPISNDCATITGVLSGDLNDITGTATNKPSALKVINSMCKPNGYSTLENFSSKNAVSGTYTFTDEFNVSAHCCGNNSIADNNTACKGAFLSSGSNAQTEAQSLGIPFLCDSSSGTMECFKNTCTPFVSDAELCAECDLNNYSFNANSNRCVVDFPIVLTGHENLQKFYNDTQSGYADVSCNNGVSSLDDARCFNNCLNKRVTWENKNKTAVCYFDLPNSKYRHYLEPTDNDRSNPNLSIGDKTDRIISVTHTGVAEFHCDDGNWVENSEDLTTPLCFASCNAQNITWGSGISKDGRSKVNACSSSVPTQRHFLQPNFSSADGVDPMKDAKEDPLLSVTTSGLNNGAAQFRCNDGSWELNGTQTCNLDCNAQTVSWTEKGATASASVSASKHGTTLYNVVATSGINLGKSENNKLTSSVTNLVCDDGRYIPITPVVAEDCKAGTITRNSANFANTCTFNWGILKHTNSGKLLSSTNSGSVNYSCNDGQIEFDANSLVCNASCAATTVSWGRTSGLSSSCLTGYTRNGAVCQKDSKVSPTCASGLTFNNNTDQCESNITNNDSYAAVASCDGVYSSYNENGFSCEKLYSTTPKCSAGKIFNGSECVSISGFSSNNGSWTCPSGTIYHATYIDKNTLISPKTYYNVCVASNSKQPNCATGYSFNTTTGTCTTNTLSDAQLSCRTATGTYTLLVTPSMTEAYTNVTKTINDCSTLAISGKCCIKSNYSCRNTELELSFNCNDWDAYVPDAACPTGSSFDPSSKKCAIVSSKPATCDNNYILSGNTCTTNIITDASLKCNDGTSAPCTDTLTSQATCSTITLDNGSYATPTLSVPFCKYSHIVNNIATRTCPSGGSAIGNVCYVSSSTIITELPTCSNGGILNKSTNLCEATETMAPRTFEPITCSGTIGSGVHTTNGISVSDNTTNGATGSATMSCVDGNWIATNSFCAQDCSPIITAATNSLGSMSWSTGETLPTNHAAYGMNCSTNNISMSNYAHSARSENNLTKNSGQRLVGSISYQCVDGRWDVTSSSCSRTTCAALTTTFSGASTCAANVPSMKWGDKNSINQPLGFSGATDAIYSCGDSGNSTLSNSPDCNADCNIHSNTNSYIWSEAIAGCVQSTSNYLDHQETLSIKDISGTSRGNTTLTCNNGTITKNSEKCRFVTLQNTAVYWNSVNGSDGKTGSCTSTLPNDLMLGSAGFGATDCATVSNTNSNFTGEATICATGTGITKTSGTCAESCSTVPYTPTCPSGYTYHQTYVKKGEAATYLPRYSGYGCNACPFGSITVANNRYCMTGSSTSDWTITTDAAFRPNDSQAYCKTILSGADIGGWEGGFDANWSMQRKPYTLPDVLVGNVCVKDNLVQDATCPSGSTYTAGTCVNTCSANGGGSVVDDPLTTAPPPKGTLFGSAGSCPAFSMQHYNLTNCRAVGIPDSQSCCYYYVP